MIQNNPRTSNSRRTFISNMLMTGITLQIPSVTMALFNEGRRVTKVGLITDLHQDIMHDGQNRMEDFLKYMKKIKPDAIMQMGDFAYPGDKNKTVIDLFNNAHQQRMHVIGNHDTDSGYTKQQCCDYWGMPARYYVKEVNGIRFVILDGNDKGSPTHKGGYPSFINNEQFSWLEQQLADSSQPLIIVSHQPLAGAAAVDNADKIQELLGEYSNKILLAVNGHTHIDSLVTVKNVNYVHINSASYFWVGGNFKHNSYSKEIHTKHPWISSTCPYQDSLFATLHINPSRREITIEGRKSNWVGSSPADINYPNSHELKTGKEIAPWISNRKVSAKSI